MNVCFESDCEPEYSALPDSFLEVYDDNNPDICGFDYDPNESSQFVLRKEEDAFLLFSKDIKNFLSKGKAIAWGIVPTDPEEIKKNLISQLTAPVKWTQTIQQMIADGGASFTEVGPGKVLQGLMRKIDRTVDANGASLNIEA